MSELIFEVVRSGVDCRRPRHRRRHRQRRRRHRDHRSGLHLNGTPSTRYLFSVLTPPRLPCAKEAKKEKG